MRPSGDWLIASLAASLAGPADAATINVCYTNNTTVPMHFGLFFPRNNSISQTVVEPTIFLRQGGDTDGLYCISPTYFTDARDCPIDAPDTQSGFQVELSCP